MREIISVVYYVGWPVFQIRFAKKKNRFLFLQQGVSRVDIVVLLTCLSTLATVAVPRYMSSVQEIRRADGLALAQNIESSVQSAHLLWQARGRPAVLSTDQGEVSIVNGYPSRATVAVVMDHAEIMAFNFSAGAWQHHDVSVEQRCGASYWPPAAPGTEPRIQVNQSGC